jgi:hypothetical protein
VHTANFCWPAQISLAFGCQTLMKCPIACNPNQRKGAWKYIAASIRVALPSRAFTRLPATVEEWTVHSGIAQIGWELHSPSAWSKVYAPPSR